MCLGEVVLLFFDSRTDIVCKRIALRLALQRLSCNLLETDPSTFAQAPVSSGAYAMHECLHANIW